MQLPFTIIFEPPSRAELRRIVRSRWVLSIAFGLVAIGTAAFAASRVEAPSGTGNGQAASLQISSRPSGAAVDVDGQTRGRTPAAVPVTPGSHQVTLRLNGYGDATYTVTARVGQITVLSADLWLRSPQVQRLRPAYPGTSIVGGTFLGDGRVALTVGMSSGSGRHLWLVDDHGGTQRLGPPDTQGSLAVSPDGSRVAYLAPGKQDSSPIDERLAEVWISSSDGDPSELRYSLPPNAGNERLLDLSWAPDGQRLLLVARRQLATGGYLTRLLRLDSGSGESKELVSMPSDVIPGSYDWSSDGKRVAFLTQAGQLTSLCLVDIEDGEFRYLADLGQDAPGPLSFAPLAWSADGQRVLYAAPADDRQTSGWLLGAKPTPALFTESLAEPVGKRLGKADGFSPTWRKDGSVVALARSGEGGSLTLQVVDAGGESRQVAELPVKTGGAFSALWDVAHAQALIAVRASASLGTAQVDYWLVRFRTKVA